jgi:thiol-disulfide isomerase/thioredoxin
MLRPTVVTGLLAALFTVPFASAQDGLLPRGAIAPDFPSLDRAGEEVRFADFDGKVVVLDFWATWCGPCIASFPHLQEVAAATRDEGVVVLAVCTSDTREKYEAWVEENASKYPDIHFTSDPCERGSDDFEKRASKTLYRVSGLPTKFVIGKDGKVAAGIVGNSKDDRRLEAALARVGIAVAEEARKAGEEQLAAAAERAAARAAAPPRPPFYPVFGSLRAGDAVPDFSLLGADGEVFTLSSMAGSPIVIGFGWHETLPRQVLDKLQARFGKYGVKTVGAMVMTKREDYDAWATKHAADAAYRVGYDTVGRYEPKNGQQDMAERAEFEKDSVIRKFFTGNMLPAMPAFVMLDGEQKLVAGFGPGAPDEAVANLLLHIGTKLEESDRPEKVWPDDAFEPPAPRQPEARVEVIGVGAAAPDFAMQDLGGQTLRLSDFRGKVVVLDFWATWCGPCKAAMPHAQEIASHYADQGVVVLASSTSDGRKEFEAWVRTNEEKYPDIRFAHDSAERTPERASRKLYGVSGIPQMFVIDREGRIVGSVSGYRPGEVLLDAALAKAGIEVDPATLEKAAEDQKARDGQKKTAAPIAPAIPLRPLKRN